jgi:hypothetical protein
LDVLTLYAQVDSLKVEYEALKVEYDKLDQAWLNAEGEIETLKALEGAGESAGWRVCEDLMSWLNTQEELNLPKTKIYEWAMVYRPDVTAPPRTTLYKNLTNDD